MIISRVCCDLLLLLPAAAAAAGEALPAPAPPSGLVVVAGIAGIDGTAALAASGRYLVDQVVPAGQVDELRRAALARGVHGALTIRAAPADGRLPHPSRFADAVIADAAGPGCPPRAELERIANVGAVLHLRDGGSWRAAPRPAEPGIADWTHKWYDAAGNMVSADAKSGPPEVLQWQAGPAFGKTFQLHTAIGGGAYVSTEGNALAVRSAGNGLIRWRSQARLHDLDEFLIDGDRIIARGDAAPAHGGKPMGLAENGALVAFSLADGAETALPEAPQMPVTQYRTSTNLHGFPSAVAAGDALVVAAGPELAAVDRASGRRRWTASAEDGTWFSPRVLDGVVVAAECPAEAKALARGRVDSAARVRAIRAFSLADGRQLWRTEFAIPDPTYAPIVDPRTGKADPARASLKPLVLAAGSVFLLTSSYQCRAGDACIAALDLATGALRWKVYTPEGGRAPPHNWSRTDSSQNIFWRDGSLYFVAGFGGVNGFGGGPVAVFDPATGERRSLTAMKSDGYGACGMSRATVNWFIQSANTWIGKDLAPVDRLAQRSNCGAGGFPAQGMFFVLPAVCDCRDFIRGFAGLGCEAGAAIDDAGRLAAGPGRAAKTAAGADDWPSFLHDGRRTAAGAALPARLAPAWKAAAAPAAPAGQLLADRQRDEYWVGALTAPVAAGGLVVAGCPDAMAVVALDAATGARRWLAPLPAPIDAPPTIAGGLAVAGCQDGSVIALGLDDGALVWRFDAAPARRLSMLNGRMAGAFPVPGSVLVVGDRVYASAGMHTYLGGIACWALDLATGRPLARRVVDGNREQDSPSVSNDIICQADDGTLWISGQLGLKPGDLAAVPHVRFPKPEQIAQVPLVAFTRRSSIVAFTSPGRGGSTHEWSAKSWLPRAGANMRAMRHAIEGGDVVSLTDRELTCTDLPPTWQTKPTVRWTLPAKDLPPMPSPTALIRAGGRTIVGGGSYAGDAGAIAVVDTAGKVEATFALPARVVAGGLAVAGGRLFATCVDGSAHSFAAP